ncbi:MAG: hypothetical protein JNM39_16355 [Bdellovibrionaceae bacterium]|nr:hypothetical protein [Pseudobdellovibrionaceae bacterium]
MAIKTKSFLSDNISRWGEVLLAERSFEQGIKDNLLDILEELKRTIGRGGVQLKNITFVGASKDNFVNYNAQATLTVKGRLEPIVLQIGYAWDSAPESDKDLLPFAALTFRWEKSKAPQKWKSLFTSIEMRLKNKVYVEVGAKYAWLTLPDEVAFKGSLKDLDDDLRYLFSSVLEFVSTGG